MDLFKNGSVTLKIIGPDGQVTDLGSMSEIGGPSLMTNSEGETSDLCDCPPGVCLGEDGELERSIDAFDALVGNIMSALAIEGGPADDIVEFDEEDEEDEAEVDERSMKIDAVAQLGRITETLTEVVSAHAEMLRSVLEI
jgi:hypothetical protein